MQFEKLKKGGDSDIPLARGGVCKNVVIACQVGEYGHGGMIPEDKIALAEEGTRHWQTGSGLAVFPPGSSGDVESVVGILERGRVGCEQGDINYPSQRVWIH